MKNNIFDGKLIAVDGPNGVGKSTIIEELRKKLKIEGYKTYITKEPTDTDLGRFIRKFAENYKGIGLACLVTADRYEHINSEIIPQLKKGKIVITDRYILSSLILQRMDGVDSNFIWNISSEILCPDLQIAVSADEKIIQKRLSERETLTRFERDNQSFIELEYLEDGVRLLEQNHVKVLQIINNDKLTENVENIMLNISCL